MANEAEELLLSYLKRLQKSKRIRKIIAAISLTLLLAIALYFLNDILPRQYKLSITGGEIISNRHYMTKNLQKEAAENNVSLNIRPTSGSEEALELIENGKLDLAFIQGGLPNYYPNVVHVATVAPEILHFLTRPDITDIDKFRGKLVNLGPKKSGTRVIAKQILEFSGLVDGVDYIETNFGQEDLISMRKEKLPDVIVNTSFVPSFMVDFLVKQRGYNLIEIPFPAPLAIRLGWATDSKILAYMYSVFPAVPNKEISTIGVNLHLVANKNVDSRAIFKILETLFSPSMEVRMKMKFDEEHLTVPSGFPLAEGTVKYLGRKNPILSRDNFEKIKAFFGLLLTIGSAIMVVIKWFKGEPGEPKKADVELSAAPVLTMETVNLVKKEDGEGNEKVNLNKS